MAMAQGRYPGAARSAADPAIVVRGLALNIFADLGMRQYQETLLTNTVQDAVGNVRRADHPVDIVAAC